MSTTSDQTCIGGAVDGYKNCDRPVIWIRSTQFSGDHPFCDTHARAEKDFGEVSSTTVWYWIEPITGLHTPYDLEKFLTVADKPSSVKELMDKARAAGHDALGIANDPEAIAALDAAKNAPTSLAAAAKARELVTMQPKASINHHTRAPNQPNEATIVEGEYDPSVLAKVAYEIRLVRNGPGAVEFRLTLNGQIFGAMPFDNLVKAATRIDPEHAAGPERQIQQLRRETAEARAEMYEWRAKATLLEEKTLQLEEKLRAFQESTKA